MDHKLFLLKTAVGVGNGKKNKNNKKQTSVKLWLANAIFDAQSSYFQKGDYGEDWKEINTRWGHVLEISGGIIQMEETQV